MPRLVFQAAARQDLASTATYIVQQGGSKLVARQFVMALRQRCEKLASLPGTLGRDRPDLGTGIRSVAHGNYVIIFRYEQTAFRVVNIIEGHRDLPRHVDPEDT